MTRKDAERQEAIDRLKGWLTPGAEVLCILRHVSRSGMQRVIDLFIIKDGTVINIGPSAAKAMGDRFDYKRDGIVVGGCEMDMGFHLVYNLGRALFPEGFKVEGHGRNGDTSGHDADGGYALKSRWL